MYVVKGLRYTACMLEQALEAIDFVRTKIQEYTKIGEGAAFKTEPEYQEFCQTELSVNAVAHRDYSIRVTYKIKMYGDLLEVESHRILQGLVRNKVVMQARNSIQITQIDPC